MTEINLVQEGLRLYAKRKHSFFFLTGLCGLFGIFYVKDLGLSLPLLFSALVLVGAFFVILSLKDPFLSIMTLVCYLPFNGRFSAGLSRTLPMLSPSILLLGFILLLLLLKKLKSPERWALPPGWAVIAAFVLWGSLSILRNIYFGEEFVWKSVIQYWQSWLFPIVLYFLFYNLVRERDDKVTLIALIMGTVFLVALLAAFSYFDGEKRVGGVFNHPNRLAAFFNYYMFLPLGILLCNTKPARNWLLGIPFLASLRGLMVTFSRGGYAAFAFGVFILTFYRSKILFFIMLLSAVFLYMNPQFLPNGIRWRLGQTVKETYVQNTGKHYTQLDPSLGNRFVIWKAATAMIERDPVWGVGYHRFRPTIQNYWKEGIPFDAHNTFLCVAAESGVPAAFFLVCIIYVFYWRASKVYWNSLDPVTKGAALGFLGGIGGYIVSNLYVSRLDYTEIFAYFWILAAIILQPGEKTACSGA